MDINDRNRRHLAGSAVHEGKNLKATIDRAIGGHQLPRLSGAVNIEWVVIGTKPNDRQSLATGRNINLVSTSEHLGGVQ